MGLVGKRAQAKDAPAAAQPTPAVVKDDVGLVAIEPEIVVPREVEGFTAGVRIVEVTFTAQFEDENFDFIRDRANQKLVVRAFIFTDGMVPYRALVIVSEDIDVSTPGFRRMVNRLREAYLMTSPTLHVDWVVGATTYTEGEIGPIDS